jgi:UDP-N-acetylmuramyl tripeptide synthase
VNAATVSGTLPIDIFLAEVDEGALLQVAPEISLEVLVVTSLFRDQLDRFGEIYALAGAIDSVAATLEPTATVIVNGDDPMVADMARDRTGRRLTFGLEVSESFDRISGAADSIRCPRCRSDLQYDQVYLSHLGSYRCDNCGFGRPALDIAVTEIHVRGLQATDCTIRTPAGEHQLSIPQAGVHVAYNAAAALAICHALNIPVPHASASLASVQPAFGRMEHIHARRTRRRSIRRCARSTRPVSRATCSLRSATLSLMARTSAGYGMSTSRASRSDCSTLRSRACDATSWQPG